MTRCFSASQAWPFSVPCRSGKPQKCAHTRLSSMAHGPLMGRLPFSQFGLAVCHNRRTTLQLSGAPHARRHLSAWRKGGRVMTIHQSDCKLLSIPELYWIRFRFVEHLNLKFYDLPGLPICRRVHFWRHGGNEQSAARLVLAFFLCQ